MHIGNYKPKEVGLNLMSLELLKYFLCFLDTASTSHHGNIQLDSHDTDYYMGRSMPSILIIMHGLY